MRWWVAGMAVCLAVLVVGLMLPGSESGAQPKPPEVKKEGRTLTASGSATIRVKPDGARISFGIKTTGPNMKAARTDIEKATKKVADALTGLKIPDLQVKTSAVDVQLMSGGIGFPAPGIGVPRGGGADPGAGVVVQPPEGFHTHQVTQSFLVVVKESDPEKLVGLVNQVVYATLDNGANTPAVVNNPNPFGGGLGVLSTPIAKVEFFRHDDSELRRQALAKATAEAIANVKTMAGSAKVTILDTVTIAEPPPNYSNDLGLGWPYTNPTTDAVGETEITIRVSVTCTY